MLLIYTHKITPRLKYSFKQICTGILKIPIKITSSIDDFILHDAQKFSYTTKPLGNELHIKSHDLLFEQGLTDIEIKVQDWDGVSCFFPTGAKNALPFDIFSAAFYLLSRYEEYLPHVKDDDGRFPVTESLAYNKGFLRDPIIDIWSYRFLDILQERFPEYINELPSYSIQALIDVEQAYDLYKIGALRHIIGFFQDLTTFRFKRLLLRIQVNLGFRKDPHDTFNWLINIQKQIAHKFIFFFQLGNYSSQTKNIRVNKNAFQDLIKMIGDYSEVGVLFSKEALNDVDQLKLEKLRLEQIMNKPLNAVRCSKHFENLGQHYRDMIRNEAKNDYSMGYPDYLGFRAGTCTPFLFYDMEYESVTPLKINPICAQSGVFEHTGDKELDLNKVLDQFLEMREAVKRVNGVFVFSFKNDSFRDDQKDNKQWKQFFKELLYV